MAGYWQVQEVFGQGSIPVGAFLCSGSGLSPGIWGFMGYLTCTELVGTPSPAWVGLQAGALAIRPFTKS